MWILQTLQAEPTAEVVKERYVAPIAAIAKEQVSPATVNLLLPHLYSTMLAFLFS